LDRSSLILSLSASEKSSSSLSSSGSFFGIVARLTYAGKYLGILKSSGQGIYSYEMNSLGMRGSLGLYGL
jgi:hypothetical protein